MESDFDSSVLLFEQIPTINFLYNDLSPWMGFWWENGIKIKGDVKLGREWFGLLWWKGIRGGVWQRGEVEGDDDGYGRVQGSRVEREKGEG